MFAGKHLDLTKFVKILDFRNILSFKNTLKCTPWPWAWLSMGASQSKLQGPSTPVPLNPPLSHAAVSKDLACATKEVSESSVIRTGVPQGSVLGPILFNVYTVPLVKFLQQHGMPHHLYADDTQLYVDVPPTKHADALARV